MKQSRQSAANNKAEMLPEPIIELKDINFSYGREPVLQGISLSINRGDYYGIIGPNGGGKTTLLKVILGLLRLPGGSVRLFGSAIGEFREWSRIGYLPQKMTQADPRFPITVAEVVGQGRIAKAGLFKKLDSGDRAAIDKALEMSGVADLKHRLISELSGGERQRVFIARALASEPEVLILDEPAAGIDVASQTRFYRFLKELNTAHGMTILFVSHDIDILANEATHLLCINQRLVCEGPASRIFEENRDLLENLYGEAVKHRFHGH